MNRFFKNTLARLQDHPILEASAMTGVAMLLVLAAVFVSQGGMSRINDMLAVYGITGESQTGCIFPCNSTAYSLQALIPMQGGVPVSSVAPGTNVDWIFNAGAYGANNFNPACTGRMAGYQKDCWVTLGSPPSNFGNYGSCTPAYYTQGPCTDERTGCDKYGSCITTCYAYGPNVYHPAVGCGNADVSSAYYGGPGGTCYGASGGYPPNYSCPGYSGNWPGTLVMAAPSTPGTYTYQLCSSFLIWYAPPGAGQGCLATTLTVAVPCTVSAAGVPSGNLSGYYVNSGGVGSVTVSSVRYCVRNYTGASLYIPLKTATEWNTFKSSADAGRISVGINTY